VQLIGSHRLNCQWIVLWRAALLLELSQEYGFDFDIMTAEIDERSLGDRTKNPEQLVLQLASAKAQALIQQLHRNESKAMQHLLITCDQVVVSSSGSILEKPLNADEVSTAVLDHSLKSGCSSQLPIRLMSL
jgi:predicted house-cleaning NTP pyrophosphatase (Maf/HAM1 superfamily)